MVVVFTGDVETKGATMRAEVSCLFHLDEDQNIVKAAEIGSDVHIEEFIGSDWRSEVLAEVLKDPWVEAKQRLENRPYTHRFYVSLERASEYGNTQVVEDAEQLIIRAIVLSRIVHPNPIATGGLWIRSFYPEGEKPRHVPKVGAGFYGKAYVAPNADKTITRDDVNRMRELWPPFQNLFKNEEKYRRILRALKFFDGGYHIFPSEFRHIVFFAALEALICTTPDSTRTQLAQRLPRLVPVITERQAITIYELYEDIKHSATPLRLRMVKGGMPVDDAQSGSEDELVADNQERLDAVGWLETALRRLLERAIEEPEFADSLCDRAEFKRHYPVEIKRSSIGRMIVRDPTIRGGRPVIAGTGVTVHRVAGWYKLGLRPEEIASRIGLSPAQVYAALAHYHANRDLIDDEIAADEAEADRLEQEHYLSLQSSS